MDYQHQPVLLEEVLAVLQPKKGQRFIDATLGGAGYTTALAKAVGDNGLVVSFDLDPMAISAAQETLAQAGLKNVLLINDNFANLSEALIDNQISGQFDGIVMDLGLSSAQIADEERGFSFNQTGPLDMAFGPNSPISMVEVGLLGPKAISRGPV